ncbi:MAG: hypothetical protein ACOYMZ_03540 [Minisyncoccia bacterium]
MTVIDWFSLFLKIGDSENQFKLTVMKYIIVLSIVTIFSFKAFSQLGVYGRYTKSGKVEMDFNFYGTKKISKKVSLTIFTLVEQTWSEALVGISYSPKDWISFGASTGIEQNPALYRFGAFVWLGKGKTSFLSLWEKGDGTDNYWYNSTLSYKTSEKFSLGLRAWRYHGVGPVATNTVKKLDTKVWLMPAYDFESNKQRVMLGISVKL